MDVPTIIYKNRVNPWKALCFQIWSHCYFHNIKNVSQADLQLVALLYLDPGRNFSTFCKEVAARGIFKNPQTARNAVNKAWANKLITKEGVKKNVLNVNPDIQYSSDPNVLLNYNLLAIGTPEPPSFIKESELKEIKKIVKLN